MLSGDPDFRKTCSDPIPTCGMPCKKILPCKHYCQKSCHERKCTNIICKIIDEQKCECGMDTRMIECHIAQK
jgi:transcriptional repressor NF-X1